MWSNLLYKWKNQLTEAVATVRHKHLACGCYRQLDRYQSLNDNIFNWYHQRCITNPMLFTAGFLPICQNQIQGLFKDFQGPYEGYIRRTKLNETSTFISIYKHHKLPQWGPGWSSGRKWILCTFEVRKKPSGTPFSVSTGSVTAF